VGEKPRNAYGLYDVHGNVWEWCQDCWSDDYSESSGAHPQAYGSGDTDDSTRVVRGGAFRDAAGYARSASRGWNAPGGRWDSLGFRPARVITE